jgi:hypothetical protein
MDIAGSDSQWTGVPIRPSAVSTKFTKPYWAANIHLRPRCVAVIIWARNTW